MMAVVSEREDRRTELEHLRGALKYNGHLEWISRDLSEDNNNELDEEVETSEETMETTEKERSKKIPVAIPYIKGFSEWRHVFRIRRYGVPTYFKPTNTLRQLLVKLKDPVSKENMVGPVYKTKCEELDAVYVCETERSLKARFNKHRQTSSSSS